MPFQKPPFDSLPLVASGPPGNAWGLFGDKDELGMLNLLTTDTTAAAAKEIVDGVRVCTDWPLGSMKVPCFGRTPLEHQIKNKSPRTVNDDILSFNTQSSSQWDGFRHYGFQKEKLFFNGHTQQMLEQSTRIGVGAWVDHGGIVGRGVLLDYAAWAESNGLTISHFTTTPIPVSVLEAIAAEQQITFRQGDILFIRTGWTSAYAQLSTSECEELASKTPPPLIGVESSEATLRWIWDHGFAAVAGDQPSFEAWPCQNQDYWLHEWLLAGWGMPIGELFDLERLGEECRKRKRWTFFFSSVPLRVPGGVASPPNGVAIF